jgi:hypothetical protein
MKADPQDLEMSLSGLEVDASLRLRFRIGLPASAKLPFGVKFNQTNPVRHMHPRRYDQIYASQG